MHDELNAIPIQKCKAFTRNGSCMYEYNNLEDTDVQRSVVNYFHSSNFLKWLEKVTGIESLIPDPHLIGAGYAKGYSGDSLKVHTDFNWNEQLKLHRKLSMIVYLNPVWNESWGGSLEFFDTDRKTIISKITPGFGNMILWSHDDFAFHGYPNPMKLPNGVSRKNIRLFYYVSNSKHDRDHPPHRSLYWYDDDKKIPYDKKEEI